MASVAAPDAGGCVFWNVDREMEMDGYSALECRDFEGSFSPAASVAPHVWARSGVEDM